MPRSRLLAAPGGFLAACGLAACSGDAGPDAPVPCAGVEPAAVAVGTGMVLDPAANGGCVVLVPGDAGAEYLVVAFSGAGQQLAGGIRADARLSAATSEPATGTELAAARVAEASAGRAARFHAAMREGERRAAHARAVAPRPVPLASLAVPPASGSTRTFQVCASLQCDAFVPVAATARFVGERVAVYLDDDVPAGGLTATDVADVGALFDDALYPIDTTAFGRESDLDGNGIVAVLLTDAVNALSGDCSDGSVVLGYFYGPDLVPSLPGSNGGEVFYARVPSAAPAACRHTRDAVLRDLPPTFVHELQHMISFNQRVLLRGGEPEAVWLNEGLSHFAEELGARLVPDGPVQGSASNRVAQFLTPNFRNASDYLASPESHWLVTPGSSFGTAAERGANWLFVRWLADHFGGGDVRGTALTRALVATTAVGFQNVEARSGEPFAALAGRWLLASYLDGLPGFSAADPRLQYASIDLRASLASLWPVFPLVPDSTSGRGYARSAVLRGGSGFHVRLVPNAPAERLALELLAPGNGGSLAQPRLAVARVR
jgi:hypothetical protein